MRILKITFSMGNDFYADMECEHCSSVQHIKTGYHDGYYHNHVIPAMTCQACGLNRAGDNPAIKNPQGTRHVEAANQSQ